MVKIDKPCVYFVEPGPENTGDVLNAVVRRLKEGDIDTVVVASTSGSTGVRFAEALKGKAKVVAVSHEEMEPNFKEEIVRLGGIAVDKTHIPFDKRGMEKVKNTFYTLGQGLKVAVEVILIATDNGVIKPYRDVIGVAGTDRGSDTAIVARATPTKEAFSEDVDKKLEIREIIAMPLKKKWWD
ncbi:MAG: pyruvate kinase alpha/beta domain-containing protein [Candidatus Bathyarchaeia archaeon]